MGDLTVNEMDELIKRRYKEAIKYYWDSSKANKKWYKITRLLTIVFGALVTLIASLSSSSLITGGLVKVFALGTPILAFMLTIIAGFSQSFQWGSTWQNMVLTAEYLQKELDKYIVTPIEQRNYAAETDKLNDLVISESKGFFEKLLGSATIAPTGTVPTTNNEGADNQS